MSSCNEDVEVEEAFDDEREVRMMNERRVIGLDVRSGRWNESWRLEKLLLEIEMFHGRNKLNVAILMSAMIGGNGDENRR